MNFLKFFLIFAVIIKTSYGGSPSYCETLSTDFITLYQTCEFMIDYIVAFFKQTSTTSSVLSNGLAYSLGCKLDLMLVLLSNGTSRVTGSHLNIIVAILHGQISQPFPAPLDCLEDFLISFRNKLHIAKNADVVIIQENFVATELLNSTCLELQMDAMTYYEQLMNVIQPKIFEFLGLVNTFKDINMLDLYENYINSQVTCDIEAVAVGIADIVNGNQNDAIAYANGLTSQLSNPLNCVRTIIEMSSNLVNSSYKEVINTVQNSQDLTLTSSSVCGSFETNIAILKAEVFGMFNRIENYTLYNSFNHPELIPGFISDSSCKIYNILYVISQALSVSTDMYWFGILEALLGFSSPPFDEPLSCIGDDLMAIQARAHYLMFTFSESLNQLVVASTAFDNTTCEGLRAGMIGYNNSIHQFINDALAETTAEAQTLNSFGMLDAFINNIQNNRYCEINGLSIIFSNLLNGDYQKAFKIIDESAAAEYPYQCVEDIMTNVASYTNHLYENLIADFSTSSSALP